MNLAKHPWKSKASRWAGHSSCVLYRRASPIELKFFRVISTTLCLSHKPLIILKEAAPKTDSHYTLARLNSSDLIQAPITSLPTAQKFQILFLVMPWDFCTREESCHVMSCTPRVFMSLSLFCFGDISSQLSIHVSMCVRKCRHGLRPKKFYASVAAPSE
jgi:hypothetical protein